MIRIGRLRLFPKPETFPAGHVWHGPQTWPFWRLFSISVVRCNPDIHPNPWQGMHVWLYTRWGTLLWFFRVDPKVSPLPPVDGSSNPNASA